MIFLCFIMIGLGLIALFSTLFPELDEKICRAIFNLIMGGEDF